MKCSFLNCSNSATHWAREEHQERGKAVCQSCADDMQTVNAGRVMVVKLTEKLKELLSDPASGR